MVSIEYKNAYSEILEILKYISKEELNKIPEEILQTFSQNANKDHRFKYNPNETLREQNVSEKTRYIIAILFRDYWSTPEQRNKIIAKEKYDLDKVEEQKVEQYNYNNIFKNREKNEISGQGMILYKKTIFQRIIEKIKTIFRSE